jgi:hypothetical protein
MFKFLNSNQRKAKRLNRDAITIIEADCRNHNMETLERIAQQTKEYLEQAAERLENDPDGDYRNLAHLEIQHKQARRLASQTELSAVTLAIIYLRAKDLGDSRQSAINAIDEFLKGNTRNNQTET